MLRTFALLSTAVFVLVGCGGGAGGAGGDGLSGAVQVDGSSSREFSGTGLGKFGQFFNR